MLHIYIGVDPRQPVGAAVLCNSIWRRSSKPVRFTFLKLSQQPITRSNLTEFTFSRFLCPYWDDYVGTSLFMDADMLVLCDIYELLQFQKMALYDVQVCMDQPRFEWASLMLFNNARCRKLTPEFVDDPRTRPFELSTWAKTVGPIPSQYNHCVGYAEPRDDAKIVHYTQGLPIWPETEDSEYAKEWKEEFENVKFSVPWADLMGGSVHSKHVEAKEELGQIE